MQSIVIVIENFSGLRYQVCNSWLSLVGKTLSPNHRQSVLKLLLLPSHVGNGLGFILGSRHPFHTQKSKHELLFKWLFEFFYLF